jgi:hypothetical protein
VLPSTPYPGVLPVLVPPTAVLKPSNKSAIMVGTIKVLGVIYPSFLFLIRFVAANRNAPVRLKTPNIPCIVLLRNFGISLPLVV